MELILEGERSPRVREAQRLLRAAGYTLDVDGLFGEQTDTVVRAYQRDHDLVADGIVGPVTWAHLGGRPMPATLRQSDLVAASQALGVELAKVMAVAEVEARNSGFIGRKPVILYERHVMYRRLDAHSLDTPALARQYPRLVNQHYGGYQGGAAEHVRLEAARRIHDTSALESCSWGLFQIMGYHAERIGYDSVQAFVEQMHTGEAAHLDAFVAFVLADTGSMLEDLRAGNWAAFAHAYNGSAYERNDYDTRLAAAERRHARHHAPAPPAKRATKKKAA